MVSLPPRHQGLKRRIKGSSIAEISSGTEPRGARMATFQPRFCEDIYPLSRLIIGRANDLALTRRQVVEKLGFDERLNKGHKVLSDILTTGVVPSHLNSPALARALEVDQSVLAEVLLATAKQRDAEQRADLVVHEGIYRAGFRPHLQVTTERNVPSPIFIAALLTTEQLRIVYLPERIDSLDGDERYQIVRESIQRHFSRTSGRVPAFGRIEGYYFVQFPGFGKNDFGVEFGVDGFPKGAMVAIERLPEARLGFKHGDDRLTGLLKDDAEEIVFGGIDSED
jgi:hypothetical protein